MPLLYSIAIAAAARLGYKLAEDRKWLPGRLYRQLALDKLKSGDLEGALQFSSIALQKNPDDDKAGLVKEIIAMHRDAKMAALLKSIEQEVETLDLLEKGRTRLRRQIRRILWYENVEISLVWLLFIITFSVYILVYFLFDSLDRHIAASLLGGVAVILTIIFVFFFKGLPDKRQQRSLDRLELLASERSMFKEIEMRRNRLLQLRGSLAATK
jgi:hypothetical protein